VAAEIEERYPGTAVRLVESSGGVFEVTVDGDLVFSKVQLGRHAKPGEVIALIEDHHGK
jgi:selT/selW/selH-like putative selenoprotein